MKSGYLLYFQQYLLQMDFIGTLINPQCCALRCIRICLLACDHRACISTVRNRYRHWMRVLDVPWVKKQTVSCEEHTNTHIRKRIHKMSAPKLPNFHVEGRSGQSYSIFWRERKLGSPCVAASCRGGLCMHIISRSPRWRIRLSSSLV